MKRQRDRAGVRREGGFSLLEVVIAMAIVAVTLLALLSLITSSHRVQDDAEERTLAYNAARRILEEMRSTPLSEIYARYNGTTSDDLSGVNPGHTFVLEDLPRGVDGGPQGLIVFPETSPGSGVSENPSDALLAAELGMPKDLNRDGDASDVDLTAYDILPVKIEVEWVVPSGKTNKIQIVTFIAER